MGLMRHVTVLSRGLRSRLVQRILAYRIRYRYPTLLAHPTAIWDYGYSDLDAIELGDRVSVGAFAEILVYKRSPRSGIPGRLVIGDRSIITAGVNIRAAGGAIRIGCDCGVGQYTVLVASNHAVRAGERYVASSWDESRTGITIGDNVWISAHCVILPGSRIGDNTVIGAGSVVRGEVPPNEIWAGVPARKIKDVPGAVPAAGQSRSGLSAAPPGRGEAKASPGQ